MSIVTHTEDLNKKVEAVLLRAPTNKKGETEADTSAYSPTDAEKKVLSLILKHFVLGTTTMYTPRTEFNDLSVIGRDQYDQMAFNTYQSNNGEAWEGDIQSSWRSRALRPIVRNKCISIAAHATARLLFPKIFAFNEESEPQEDAAALMETLMEWSGEISNYSYTALMRVITALASPASIGFTEYGEVHRTVKTEKDDSGKWVLQRIPDQSYPCFIDVVVPVDQLYIENIYEPDIQKQGWLIWRRVYSYSLAQTKYGEWDNFKYVRPGVQTIYNDANTTFYNVYDANMRQEDVEEIVYYNRQLDLKIILVNGIMMTDADNPNPRIDKLYPFDKFGYEPINNRFFYYKSLSFKLQHDADIVNTLYQMIIDKTYLSIFPPMINVGGEIIASDVIVPGAITTFSDPTADLRAINPGNANALKDGLETLGVVEKSINESSQEPLQQGEDSGGGTTAYEISRLENNANTVLGLFIQMIAKHVRDFGKLRVGDIVQYLTLPDVSDITGDGPLTYKTFLLNAEGNEKTKRVYFDAEMADSMDSEEELNASYQIADEEGESMTIFKANPLIIRKLQYMLTVSPDVLQPKSTDLERAFDLETYDRAINNPSADQEEVFRLLLGTNPNTKKDPDKYVMKQQPMQQGAMPGMPQAGNSPLNSVKKSVPSPMPQMSALQNIGK